MAHVSLVLIPAVVRALATSRPGEASRGAGELHGEGPAAVLAVDAAAVGLPPAAGLLVESGGSRASGQPATGRRGWT